MTDIVEELLDFTTRDHERGCTGREYVCSCGYDNDIEAAVKKAAGEIARLRLSLSEARATGRREGLSEAAKIAEQPIKYTFPDGSPAVTRPRPDGTTIAAAIRAALEKEE